MHPGPFELTKLSAQIAVLMNDRSRSTGDGGPLPQKFEPQGTIKTAKQLIKHRGFSGLYSGFGFHLREFFLHVRHIDTRLTVTNSS